MKNYDKPWTEEGDFGTNYLTDTVGFYFDSYNLYNTLNKHSKPELYDCYDKGDEFGCNIRFENIEHLKDFFKHLTEVTELSYDKIIDTLETGNSFWDDAFEILEKTYSSEEADKLLEELTLSIEKNAK